MANRYANLVGSNKIKDEWQKINTGFDLVQQEMDAKPDKSIAQVNNVQMGTDDTLTIEGSTGIAISTNPEQKKVIITATGTSTPGPHGPSHNNDGADPIPDLQNLRAEFDAHKADNARHNTKTTFTATTPGTSYPYGVSYQEATTVNGWPSIGTVITVKEGDNRCYQIAVDNGSVASPLARYRSYHTSVGWTEWDILITSRGGTITGNLYLGNNVPLYGIDSGGAGKTLIRIVPSNTIQIGAQVHPLSLLSNKEVVLTDGQSFIRVMYGSGSPEGTIVAPVGSLYLRTDGSTTTTLYVKTSGTGNTGWTAK